MNSMGKIYGKYMENIWKTHLNPWVVVTFHAKNRDGESSVSA